MERPAISPMPPVAAAVGMPWDSEVDDPIAALAEARRHLGDTFVVDSGEDRYLFTFSPVGVAAFYGLAEERASKGVADWRMLRRKLPDEIFAGRPDAAAPALRPRRRRRLSRPRREGPGRVLRGARAPPATSTCST